MNIASDFRWNKTLFLFTPVKLRFIQTTMYLEPIGTKYLKIVVVRELNLLCLRGGLVALLFCNLIMFY
jgi:hypothetical protein